MEEPTFCPVEYVVDLISGKWKVLLLWNLNFKPRRFGELEKILRGISRKVLSQHLKELEQGGFIHREVLPTVPVQVEYSLTQQGKELCHILRDLNTFGNKLVEQKKS